MAKKSGKSNQQYDLVILGGGPGGYVAAIRAAQLGFRVGLVEKRRTLGGTCLNVGCIPSKALLDSSEFFARIRDEAANHGIRTGPPSIDVAAMMKRKEAVVSRLTGGVAMLMKSNKVDVYHGTGRVIGPGTVEIAPAGQNAAGGQHETGGQNPPGEAPTTLKTERLLLATGSVPIELPFLPFDGTTIVSSREALSFDSVPKHLLVVGGGIIGLELGSVWSRLGSQVTVVELLPGILPGWDQQVSSTMQRELSKQGLTFHLETKVTGAEVTKKGVTLQATDKSGREVTFSGDKVLVAVGRNPYLEGAGLADLDLHSKDHRIAVNERYETSVPGIWAIGDIISGPMLAHKAEDEGIAAVECMAGRAGHVNYDAIPNVLYTWPEAASVGPTEAQLKEKGVSYRVGTFPFAANGRALAMDAPAGFVKILTDEVSDRVLGAHIVGPWASDLIAELVAVVEFGGASEDIARTVHAHPTLSETVKEAALGIDGRMIHAKNK